MNALTTPVLMMTSREIAELTGKRHDNVLRDICMLLQELQSSNLKHACKSITYIFNSQMYAQYEMNKDTCLILLLSYEAAARIKVRQTLVGAGNRTRTRRAQLAQEVGNPALQL